MLPMAPAAHHHVVEGERGEERGRAAPHRAREEGALLGHELAVEHRFDRALQPVGGNVGEESEAPEVDPHQRHAALGHQARARDEVPSPPTTMVRSARAGSSVMATGGVGRLARGARR
jgi:hypothetical protein